MEFKWHIQTPESSEAKCPGMPGRYVWGEGVPGMGSPQHEHKEQSSAGPLCDRQVPYSTSRAEVLNLPKATLYYSFSCYGDSPTTKLFLFFLHSCTFAIVMNQIIKL